MSFALDQVTPLILTFNEEPNLRRTLERLAWAEEVVIVDSGSTDHTREIALAFPNVRWIERAFDDHTRQWNFGIDSVQTRWVLSLDADYVLGAGFENELAELPTEPGPAAFLANFRYLIAGRPLRGSLYPPRAVLFDKSRCRYVQDGHTQILDYPGEAGALRTRIDHDDRKSLSRWLASQDSYALLEAEKLSNRDGAPLRLQDRLRTTIVLAPPLALLYALIVKGAVLDGWRGWYYALQRLMAEVILSLRLLERKFSKVANGD